MEWHKSVSRESRMFNKLELWKKMTDISKLEKTLMPLRKNSKLFNYLYPKTKKIYAKMPPRKNGELPLAHPLNVVVNLLRAGVKDEVILCAALVHDYAEECVDLYRDAQKINEKTKKGMKNLDDYEKEVFKIFKSDLQVFCSKHKISLNKARKISNTMRLLTRRKRDFYYHSITNIFNHEHRDVREIAMIVKLADRLHNILTIESFSEQEQIYQCFKNLFILNSVKYYLKKKHGKTIFADKIISPLDKLFKKCSKATYAAFLKICHTCTHKGLSEITPMIQLALKKFALETEGMWEVTKINKSEKHLMKIFHAVLRKYDYRLHNDLKKFNKCSEKEHVFSKKFFSKYHFNAEQIQAIVDYKDAYSLKEVVAYLLYDSDYSVSGFEYTGLFER